MQKAKWTLVVLSQTSTKSLVSHRQPHAAGVVYILPDLVFPFKRKVGEFKKPPGHDRAFRVGPGWSGDRGKGGDSRLAHGMGTTCTRPERSPALPWKSLARGECRAWKAHGKRREVRPQGSGAASCRAAGVLQRGWIAEPEYLGILGILGMAKSQENGCGLGRSALCRGRGSGENRTFVQIPSRAARVAR